MANTRNIAVKCFAILTMFGCLIGMPHSTTHAATSSHLIVARVPAIHAATTRGPVHAAAKHGAAHNSVKGSMHRSGHGAKGAGKHSHKSKNFFF